MKVLAFVALACMATSVTAADRGVSDPGFVRKALDEASRCILDDKPGLARSFLQAPDGSKEAARLAQVFNRSECMQSASRAMDLEFAPALLRGSLYKQLYIRSYGTAPSKPVAAPTEFRAQVAQSSSDYEVLRQFATCVVQRDPGAARTLVMAETESAAEIRSFNSLRPAAGPCTIAGRTPAGSMAMLTGLIAEALYTASTGAAAEGPHA